MIVGEGGGGREKGGGRQEWIRELGVFLLDPGSWMGTKLRSDIRDPELG